MYDDYEDRRINRGIKNAFESASIRRDLSKLVEKTVYKKGKNPDEHIFEIALERKDGAKVVFRAFPIELSRTPGETPHLWTFRTITTLPGQIPIETKEQVESYAEGPKGFFEQSFLPKVHQAVFAHRYPLHSPAAYEVFYDLDFKQGDLHTVYL